MGSMRMWMLGAVIAVTGLALAVPPPAQAARVGVYVGVGGPAAYIPPCPGPGYSWVAGYWANGYWTPGFWNYVGVGFGRPYVRGRVVIDRGPAFYHRDFDRDRHFDNGRHYDRDHFRR